MRGPPPSKPRFPRPGADKRPGGTRRRHVLLTAAAALAVVVAALLLGQAEGLFTPRPAVSESEAQLYAGTIQLAASGANFCRRLSFDNRSGEVLDRGVARCGPTAPQEGAGDRQPAGSNLDQIRAGFLRR
jgi:hypothetical protein